jgi:hypothetical protein
MPDLQGELLQIVLEHVMFDIRLLAASIVLTMYHGPLLGTESG